MYRLLGIYIVCFDVWEKRVVFAIITSIKPFYYQSRLQTRIMRSFLYSLAYCTLVTNSIALDTTTKACPLLGPALPAPTDLSSNEKFQEAVKSFNSALSTTLETGISSNGPGSFNLTTFSIGIFSVSEEVLVYQRHYTAKSVQNAETGVHNVDADSIYRLGSISKALSVYLFLIRDGDRHFNEPITSYIPELAAAAPNRDSQNGVTPNWNEITIGQLASHMAGLSEDCTLNFQILRPDCIGRYNRA
jgi:beta-lactamase family protein